MMLIRLLSVFGFCSSSWMILGSKYRAAQLFFSFSYFFSFVFLWFILVARYFENLGNQIQLLVLFRRMRFAILMKDMCAILRRNHNHGALF